MAYAVRKNPMNLRAKRGPRDAAFQAIQRRWDKKLQRSGFVDIEGGLDLNLTDDWTFRGGGKGHGGHIAFEDLSSPNQQASKAARKKHSGPYGGGGRGASSVGPPEGITDLRLESICHTTRYQYWTVARHAAYAMDEGEPNRKLFIAIAEAGSVAAAARAHGMGRERARRLWGFFIWRAGIGKRRIQRRKTR